MKEKERKTYTNEPLRRHRSNRRRAGGIKGSKQSKVGKSPANEEDRD
jgi:hypothetical protein